MRCAEGENNRRGGGKTTIQRDSGIRDWFGGKGGGETGYGGFIITNDNLTQ